MPHSLPPRKLTSTDRREREFLYLHEVDALIAATSHTRAPSYSHAVVLPSAATIGNLLATLV